MFDYEDTFVCFSMCSVVDHHMIIVNLGPGAKVQYKRQRVHSKKSSCIELFLLELSLNSYFWWCTLMESVILNDIFDVNTVS